MRPEKKNEKSPGRISRKSPADELKAMERISSFGVDRLEEDAPVAAGVSGIRRPIDAETFRERYAGDFLLVHVRVKDPETRFRHLRERNKPRDPEEFEDFLAQDQHEEDMFQIGETLRMADEVLCNDGSLEDLHRHVEEKIIDPYLKSLCT